MMATRTPADLTGWVSRPANLSGRALGRNVELLEGGCVAERRGGGLGNGVVYTDIAVPVGHVWQVTVLATTSRTGCREGLGVGLRRTQPGGNVPSYLPCSQASEEEWYYSGQCLYHDRRSHYFPDLPSLSDLSPGQKVGLLITASGGLHLFIDGGHCREIATGVPAAAPLWGAVDVYGACTKIKSEILSGSESTGMGPEPHPQQQPTEQLEKPHPQQQPTEQLEKPHPTASVYVCGLPSRKVVLNSPATPTTAVHVYSSDHLVSATSPSQSPPHHSHHSGTGSPPSVLTQSLNGGERSLQRQLRETEAEVERLRTELGKREAQPVSEKRELSSLVNHVQELERKLQKMEENHKTELGHRDKIIEELRTKLNNPHKHRQHSEHSEHTSSSPAFWQVSAHEVDIREDRILGTGAWGKVCEGYFRGQLVAVKCVHAHIMDPKTRERMVREVNTMSQMRHPHLVLFMAAVLDDRRGPKIITEKLEIDLRSAYETKRLGTNKLRVFRNIAKAVNYLHCQRDPIIHRDLSTANVLLEAMAGGVWRAKVSDFGSANLAQFATTPGEGSVVYTAPEAFPIPPNSRTPKPAQTTKIDVYAYGVLVCEVALDQFPDSDHFPEMVAEVGHVWPAIVSLVQNCIQVDPHTRPDMAAVIKQLATLE